MEMVCYLNKKLLMVSKCTVRPKWKKLKIYLNQWTLIKMKKLNKLSF